MTLDIARSDADPAAERDRLNDRAKRAAECRDLWWLIVKDGKEMQRTGHAAAVRWARAGLGLDDRPTP